VRALPGARDRCGGALVSARRKQAVVPTPGRTLLVLPAIGDDWSETLKNGLAIRNRCATEGRCPSCGVLGELRADPTSTGVYHLTFRHEQSCGVFADEAVA
jgi:hypothetical protein